MEELFMGNTRGKLMLRVKEDAGRAIHYMGGHIRLLCLRWSRFVNEALTKRKYISGSAIGHSWFNGGANKIIKHFEDEL